MCVCVWGGGGGGGKKKNRLVNDTHTGKYKPDPKVLII